MLLQEAREKNLGFLSLPSSAISDIGVTFFGSSRNWVLFMAGAINELWFYTPDFDSSDLLNVPHEIPSILRNITY